MHRMTRIAVLVVLIVPTILMTTADGYSVAGYKWRLSPVLSYVNPTKRDVTITAAEHDVVAGMNAWNGKTSFKYAYGGRVKDTSTSMDGRNVVIFRSATNGAAVATTYTWSKNGSRFDSDTVFWDGKYRFYTGTSGCSG